MSIKIDQIFGGDNAIRLDYLTIDGYNDPTATSNTGTIYAKDIDGYTELFYFDDYSNSIQVTSKGSIIGGTGNTLDQAYDQGGAGAGRIITADSGAVMIDANGAEALNIDGYLSLDEIIDPTGVSNKGFIYSKDIEDYTELFYMDNYGNIIQITDQGTVYSNSTTASVQYYVDGTAGSDSNDGLSWGNAKATMNGMFAIIPLNIFHNTSINCRNR
ncbi:unnamed protein product, partial [marine sediment metagenome]